MYLTSFVQQIPVSNTSGSGDVLHQVSPSLSGTPQAPTAAANTNTNQIATTAFVSTAVSGAIAAIPTPASIPDYVLMNAGVI